jgi:hypothetical protein
MNAVRRPRRAILWSLAWGLLIACSAPFVAAVTVYVTGPPPAEPDPAILVILVGLTLGSSIMLGIAVRRARLVSTHWDLGPVGGRVLMFASLLLAAILGIAGVYTLFRIVTLFGAD